MEQTATESAGLTEETTAQTNNEAVAQPAENAQAQQAPVDTSWTLDGNAYGSDVSPDFISGYTDLAKAAGLDQSKAGDLLGKALEMANQIEAKANEARVTEWANELRTDPKFGGEMFDANLNIAKSALKQFGSPALVNVLNDTGLGNNPDVIRFFWAVGKTIQEDSVVTGTTARSDADVARIMFPTMKQ